MEGPYRDLGAGFARLTGAEGLRRGPTRLRSVEDALLELVRNARDAGARNIYVASTLKSRRYRVLTVIDDGIGIPETHKHLIFEPGVTTRHLSPVVNDDSSPHGAGLSLHHIKNAAASAEVLQAHSPTSLRTIFDTKTLPERSLQSGSRMSRSNLTATLASFVKPPNSPRLYHASPAEILARLLNNRIIQTEVKDSLSAGDLREAGVALGLVVSERTARRVLSGDIRAASEVAAGVAEIRERVRAHGRIGVGGPILDVGDEYIAQVRAVLHRAARASYLELEGLAVERRPGEVVLRARVYEPEGEYDEDHD